MEDYEEFDQMMGMAPTPPATPEIGYFKELTEEGKYKAIHNVVHWLKHELYLYMHLKDKGYDVYSASGTSVKKVNFKDVTRAILEYYFLMRAHARFNNERAREQGKQVDLQKFLDLVMEYPDIKKLIANPHELV